MNTPSLEETDQAIIHRFRMLFVPPEERHNSEFEVHNYFECESGWYTVLYALFDSIYRRYEHCYNESSKDAELMSLPYITDIKEKFGRLRIYYEAQDSSHDSAFRMAEFMSGLMCEICGSNDAVTYHMGGFSKTYCTHHAIKAFGVTKIENYRNRHSAID